MKRMYPACSATGRSKRNWPAAACWARDQLAGGNQRIAVVINGLESLSHEVRQVFERVLCADRMMGLDELADCEFHIGHGEPLAEHPAISDALLLLQLCADSLQKEQEFPAVSQWLLSHYWGGADSERSERALLELKLRKSGRYLRAPADIAYLVEKWGLNDGLPILLEQIRSVPASDRTGNAAEQFAIWLAAWGWPGPLAGGGDLAGYVSQLGLKLESLAGYGIASLPDALAVLRQLCRESRLVLRGSALSPVQVLTPEDAAGRGF